MLIATLVVLNIPVYLFIGWLAFDSKQGATDTFVDTIVELLKQLLVPRVVRMFIGMEDDDDKALGILPIAGFFIACAFVVWGEYYLIEKYLM
jgi:hypothetical protein